MQDKGPRQEAPQITIGVIGRISSGKDDFYQQAKALAAKRDMLSLRYAFGDAGKRELAPILELIEVPSVMKDASIERITVDTLYDRRFKDIFRGLMKWYLGDFRRGYFGDDYWVKKAWYDAENGELMKMGLELGKVESALFTDVRHENEAASILERGGVLVRVVRVPDPHPPDDGHQSETEMDGIVPHYLICNRGSKEQYHDIVRAVYESIRLGDIPPRSNFRILGYNRPFKAIQHEMEWKRVLGGLLVRAQEI